MMEEFERCRNKLQSSFIIQKFWIQNVIFVI